MFITKNPNIKFFFWGGGEGEGPVWGGELVGGGLE